MVASTSEFAALEKQLQDMDASQKAILSSLRQARRPNYGAKSTLERIGRDAAPSDRDRVWKSFGHFLKALSNCPNGNFGQQPDMLRYFKSYESKFKSSPVGMSETNLADGGVLVPPEFSTQLMMRVYDNDLLSRTTLFPMGSNQLKIPAIGETSRQDGSRFGGIQAYWTGEAGTVSNTKPSFDQITLELSKLLMFIRLTDELIADTGMALETYTDTLAGQELDFKVGDAIVNGTGVQQPLGLLKSPSLVSVAAEGAQAAGTFTFNNACAMWARLHPSCHANAVWLVDPSVTEQLMKFSVGYMPVMVAPGGADQKPYMTLFGRPIIVTEFQPSVGTTGDVILCDLSTYLTGSKGGMQSGVSIHAYWLSDEQSFRFSTRLDGRSWWKAALTPKNGDTARKLSNIVTVATR